MNKHRKLFSKHERPPAWPAEVCLPPIVPFPFHLPVLGTSTRCHANGGYPLSGLMSGGGPTPCPVPCQEATPVWSYVRWGGGATPVQSNVRWGVTPCPVPCQVAGGYKLVLWDSPLWTDKLKTLPSLTLRVWAVIIFDWKITQQWLADWVCLSIFHENPVNLSWKLNCYSYFIFLCITLSLGTDLIRIGYVAYHTAVYDSFPLDKYADKRETINKIGEYTITKKILRCAKNFAGDKFIPYNY